MHHLHPNRDGNYTDRQLSHSNAANLHLDPTFAGQVDGDVYAQPLFVDRGGSGDDDLVIVATEENEVSALSGKGGVAVWQVQLGPPVPLSESGCGNIDPMGITGTPFIDQDAGAVYLDSLQVVDGGRLADGLLIQAHYLYALSLYDGSTLPGWPIDVGALDAFDGGGFASEFAQNRGALLVQGGVLYVPFGGRAGDCGDYHGVVVGVPVADPQAATAWFTPGTGGGVWGVSGVSSDGEELWVATGNGKETDAGWQGGSAIIGLDPGPEWGGGSTDFWAPPGFAALDAHSVNLAGSGTQLLDFSQASSSPSQIVTLFGMDGNLYLLDRRDLGGIASPPLVQRISLQPIKTAPAHIPTAQGALVALQASGIDCPPGQEGSDVVALTVTPGSPPAITTAWCATQSGQGSLIISTIDGVNEGLVWGIGAEGDNRLKAFDLKTGAVIYGGGGPLDGMGTVQHFMAPIIAKGRVIVGGDGRIYSFSVD